MAENIKRHVTHIKSKVVENSDAKLPTASQIEEGEIAINYAKGYETISIKNESGTVVTFSNDLIIGKKGKLTDYAKPSSTSAVATGDTINGAIGKLEKALDGKAASSHSHYWANLQTTSAANYITEPEIKSVKINGSTTNAASTSNCSIQYDTTNKCLKFIFS